MGRLINHKKAKRAQVMELLKELKISPQNASKQMGVSTRQVMRLSIRYRAEELDGDWSARSAVRPLING